jgi:hypothetical protein
MSMTRPKYQQPDLFAHLAPSVHWTESDRQKAVMLLRNLLQEAMNEPLLPKQPLIEQEAGNDQDHA